MIKISPKTYLFAGASVDSCIKAILIANGSLVHSGFLSDEVVRIYVNTSCEPISIETIHLKNVCNEEVIVQIAFNRRENVIYNIAIPGLGYAMIDSGYISIYDEFGNNTSEDVFYVNNNSVAISQATFTNSNNITFGLSNNIITASASFAGGGNISIYAGTNSLNSGSLSFVNSNGISFGMDTNGDVSASYTIPSVIDLQATSLMSNYLGTNYTSHTHTQTNFVFSNSNGIGFGTNGSTVTASYTSPTDYFSSNQSSLLQQTSLMSNYLDTGYTSHTHTQSVQTQNAISVQGSTGNISFGNANGISFGANNSTITASYTVPNDYISSSQSSLFQQTSLMSNYLGTAYTSHTHSNSQYVFSNGNGVTFGTNGSTITASVATNYLTTAAQSNQVVNSLNGSTGQISLNVGSSLSASSNGSSVTFGLATNISTYLQTTGNYLTTAQPVGAYLTTAMQSNAATISNIKLSAGTASNNLSAVTFSDSNGVTFGLNGSVITASVATNYQSQGAYLTTAMASNASSNFAGIGSAITNGTMTFGTGGLSLNLSNHLTTARASNDAIGLNTAITNNGVSITANSSGLSLNFPAFLTTAQPVGNYLTTAMASNQGSDFVQANAVFNGTNASGTISSNGISISVNAGGGGVAIKGSGVQSQSTGTVEFANSNGITFGLSNNGTLTASHNGLTTAMASNAGSNFVGLNSALTANGVSASINSSGISLNFPAFLTTAQPVGAYLTTAMASNAATISNINLSAGTTSNNLSAITFTNANGVSFGLNGSVISASVATNYQSQGAYLTTAMLSNAGSDFIQATAAFNGTNASGTIGSNGFSVSVANPGVQFSAGTLASQRTNIVFGDANGVSFGLNPTGQITATVQLSHSLGAYAVGNTTQSTSGTMNVNTVSFRGEGIASVGVSNGSVVISVPSGGGGLSNINVSAGTTSNNLSNVIFSNANGLSFGLDGSTITASGDGNVTYKGFNPNPNMIQAYVAQGAGTLHVQKMPSAPNFTFDRVVMGLQYSNATNSSNSCTVSLSFGIYSLNVSTLSLIGSNSTSFNISNSGTAGSYSLYSGARLITLGMSSSLSAGDYYIGIWSRTTTGGGAGMTINQIGRSALNSVFAGQIGLANNASYAHEMGLGVYSASFSTAMPSAMSMTQLINGTATVVQRQPFYSFAHTTF